MDILALIGRDTQLKRVASTNGGEWAGPCPFCGGDDRFRVWPEHPDGKPRFWCRQCERHGDMIDYVQEHDKCSFREACEALNLNFDEYKPDRFSGLSDNGKTTEQLTVAPPDAWQDRARQFVEYAQDQLWNGDTWALDYLHERGLTDAVILHAGLGYNPRSLHDKWESWGLEPVAGKKGVWCGAGIVIPWEIGGDLWRVNVRLKDPFEGSNGRKVKYIGPAGFRNGLYNADALNMDKPAVLTEGEIDALTIMQNAEDLVAAVATGSTGGSRRTRWLGRLALPPRVLVAYDNEVDKGDEAAKYWLDALSNAKRWRPYWEDANAMARDGANVRHWVQIGLGQTARIAA